MYISHIRKSLLFFALIIFILVALGYNGNAHFVLLPVAFALWVVSEILGVPPTP